MTESGPSRGIGSPVLLESLTKHYGSVVAVDSIDLAIEAGEFLTLLGPSGSGKTTTLMMVAGFQEVTSGVVLVGDRDITDLPPHKRDVGVVFQHYALFPHMRVADNVAFPLRMRRVSKSEITRRVTEALGLVRLSGLERRFPRQLSGGQQQRVALARALVFEPGLALMDEPLGALDRQLREEMQYEIKRLQESLGVTVVYVTHDQGEAIVMSDRIAVMNRGHIEQCAPPETLYDRPETAFVSTFVGESNLLEGIATGTDSRGVGIATDGGLEAIGTASGTIAHGDRVVATIRPEKLDILVVPDAETRSEPGATNSTSATCEEAIYAGDVNRYTLRTASGDQLLLRIQNRPGAARVVSGDRLELRWSFDDMRVFPAEASETWTQLEDGTEPAPTTGA